MHQDYRPLTNDEKKAAEAAFKEVYVNDHQFYPTLCTTGAKNINFTKLNIAKIRDNPKSLVR